MENASKALSIAAGVLLGVMLFALIVYFFSSLGAVPQEEADAMSVEQLAAFNMEYEVYNKSMMYGVDVISCLNKAKDNNDKYLSENQEKFGFLTEGKYPPDYVINVLVTLNHNYLEESVEVYYMDENNKEVLDKRGASTHSDSFKKVFGSYVDFSNLKVDNHYITTIKEGEYNNNEKIVTFYDHVHLEDSPLDENEKITISLLDLTDINKPKSNNTILEKLLVFSGKNMKIQLKNPNGSEQLRTNWSSIIWKTALYDLKQKKFKLSEEDGITYNEKTGRVKQIHFEEV